MFEDFDFEPNNREHGWNGVYRGKDVNPGVFAWLVKYIDCLGEERLKAGDVTVYR